MFSWLREKLNPAQSNIAIDEGTNINEPTNVSISNSFDTIDAVRRGSSLVINGCASLDYDVKNTLGLSGNVKVRGKALNKLLNFKPNPFQSAYDFKLNIFTDLIFNGSSFIYFDGTFIYHLPAANVEVLTDEKTFIKGYKYSNISFNENEVFSFKDVNNKSIYRGTSRLNAAKKSIDIITSMQNLQQGFFDNGAVFGTVFTTENTLSTAAKERTILHFLQKWNPKRGTRRPVILDNGLKPHSVANNSFKEMDFDTAMKTHSEKILNTLGVPPILLAGGNNANISPNLRLFYLETVMPIVRSFSSSLERFFGFDIKPITENVTALQPDVNDVSNSLSTLINGGVITPNEGRDQLRYPALDGLDEIRVPANIAGSAGNPSEGGRPTESEESNEE